MLIFLLLSFLCFHLFVLLLIIIYLIDNNNHYSKYINVQIHKQKYQVINFWDPFSVLVRHLHLYQNISLQVLFCLHPTNLYICDLFFIQFKAFSASICIILLGHISYLDVFWQVLYNFCLCIIQHSLLINRLITLWLKNIFLCSLEEHKFTKFMNYHPSLEHNLA